MRRAQHRRSQRSDEGAAILWSLALVTLLLLVGMCILAVAMLAVARQHAAATADIAALAAAQAGTDPCGQAASSARANGAELTTCNSDGVDVVIAVSMPAPRIVSRLFALLGRQPPPVTASSRAGPP